MKEQMTVAGVVVLCTAIVLFWAVIAAAVRKHSQKRAR